MDSFVDLMAYVAYFIRSLSERQPAFPQVKADILRFAEEINERMKRGADTGEFSREDFDLACFAVFSWVDEAITNSAWREKNLWLGEPLPLQRLYYDTANAGEIFFDRLNALGPHQRDVREVYYLCLALGFQGRYCHEGDAYLLEQLRASNLKVLTGSYMGSPSLEKEDLFPEAYSRESLDSSPTHQRRRISLFAMGCVIFPVLFWGALFIVCRFFLDDKGQNLLKLFP